MASIFQMMRDALARATVELAEYKVEPIRTSSTISIPVDVGNKSEFPYAVYGLEPGTNYTVWAELKDHIRGVFVSAVIKDDGLLYLTVCNYSGAILPASTEVNFVIAQAISKT